MLFGAAHTYIAHIREYPPPRAQTKAGISTCVQYGNFYVYFYTTNHLRTRHSLYFAPLGRCLLLISILSAYQVGLFSKVLLNVTYQSGLTTTLLRSLCNRDEAKKAKIHEERWMLNCPIC